MLNAMDFEEFVSVREGLPEGVYNQLEYSPTGRGIVLRLVDVRTFGGQVRLYNGAEGEAVDTGSTTVPMRVRRPFRLAPMSAYVLYFHLKLDGLPEGVFARVIPSAKMSGFGLVASEGIVQAQELSLSVMPLRMIEVTDGYPMAELVFDQMMPRALTGSSIWEESVGAPVTRPLAEHTPRRKKTDAKNTPNRR